MSSTFYFSKLYSKLPHKDLLKVLFDLIGISFNGGSKKDIFHYKMLFGRANLKQNIFFSKIPLKRPVLFLIEKSYFDNVLLLEAADIYVGIESAPFWANLYLYNYESKYIANLIKK